MNKKYQKMASDLAKAGRYGDDQLVHVSRSELAGLGSLLPSGKLPINPETGQPEAFIFTLSALLISMAIGAATGAISGGVTAKEKGIPLWEGILTGAGTGAATGMVTAGIGGALAPAGTAAVDAGAQSLQAAAGDVLTSQIADQGAQITGQVIGDGISQAASEVVKEGTKEAIVAGAEQGRAGAALDGGTKGGLDLVSQNLLDQSTNALVSEAPGVTADVAADVAAQAPGIAADAAPEVIKTSGEVLANEAPSFAADVGTEVLVDGAENVAEQGFFDGLKESALGLKEQAIEKLGPNNVEFLDWYTDNPVAMMAPAAITQATQRWELDEDDEDGYYSGPYDKSWESGPGVSWAAKDGGEVKRRGMKSSNDAESLSRIKSLINMLQKTMNPTIPGKYNPLSDEDIRMKIRPNMPGGMQRVGVTLPFRQGGLASRNLRSGGLGSLRRP